MPLAFRPGATVPVSLRIDRDLKPGVRPEFLVRAVSEGEALAIAAAFEDDSDDDKARAALAAVITGWRNFPPEAGAWKGADSLRCLTAAELVELRDLVTGYGVAGPFASPSGSPS